MHGGRRGTFAAASPLGFATDGPANTRAETVRHKALADARRTDILFSSSGAQVQLRDQRVAVPSAIVRAEPVARAFQLRHRQVEACLVSAHALKGYALQLQLLEQNIYSTVLSP
jgi:hypothetical protein